MNKFCIHFGLYQLNPSNMIPICQTAKGIFKPPSSLQNEVHAQDHSISRELKCCTISIPNQKLCIITSRAEILNIYETCCVSVYGRLVAIEQGNIQL